MADADEDTIPRSANIGEDSDLTDETQDFRFLYTYVTHQFKPACG